MKELLLKKEKQITEQAKAVAQEVTDWQAVRNYLTRRISEIELTDTQREKMEIYQLAYNQLVSGKYTEFEVVDMIMVEFECSKGAAMQHLRDSKEIFSTAFNINVQFELKIQLEINRVMLQIARSKGDLKAYAALEKNRAKMMEMAPVIEEESHDDFEGHVIVPVFDPSIMGFEPIDQKELNQLFKDMREKYGDSKDLRDIEEAEIVP